MNSQPVIRIFLGTTGTSNRSRHLYSKRRQTPPKARSTAEKPAKRSAIMNSPSLLDWYRMLRAHHQWTVFQAIRYALWLAR
jgi:hypothetical protein